MTDLIQLSRVNPSRSQDLIDLSIFRLICLQNSFDFLLENKVLEPSLSVHLVGQLMEPIMKFFLFPLQVLKLLEFDFVFPLLVTDTRLHFFRRPNDSLKVSLHFSMLLLELNQLSTLFSCLLKWL